jgi:hypothetical protein
MLNSAVYELILECQVNNEGLGVYIGQRAKSVFPKRFVGCWLPLQSIGLGDAAFGAGISAPSFRPTLS